MAPVGKDFFGNIIEKRGLREREKDRTKQNDDRGHAAVGSAEQLPSQNGILAAPLPPPPADPANAT
ncbi:uncharacterized protein DS421_11g336690 [Arachis hypogaea]|nr:uncharacterized protein DS421_11g336690 [Arachis hypogaea]